MTHDKKSDSQANRVYRHGLGEHALHLMTKGGLRSWQNMLEKGATMTMEAWDDSLKPNQDWNHAWGAAPAGIIPRFLCGVRPVLPGFRKFIVDPQPALDGPIFLKHPTPHGPILLERDQQNHWLLAVPDCTTALFHGRELSPGKHQLSKI